MQTSLIDFHSDIIVCNHVHVATLTELPLQSRHSIATFPYNFCNNLNFAKVFQEMLFIVCVINDHHLKIVLTLFEKNTRKYTLEFF